MVAMSGGVDSSVSALLLQQQGLDIAGMFMKNWHDDSVTISDECPWLEDSNDALLVAEKLGIPFQAIDLSKEYKERIVDYMFAEYERGRTPNPDVLCNREIKFKQFADYAQALGADAIATGHYVRGKWTDDAFHLLKGRDSNKDQSYFLQAVPNAQLAKCLFPLGELEKTTVREIADKAGFHNHRKKDSTGICFIGERRFSDFLQRYLSTTPGKIRDMEGMTLGEHIGLPYYTLGQRQGLGIGGVQRHAEAPWYVAAKDRATGDLIVSQDPADLQRDWLAVSELNWLVESPELPLECSAKVRYRQSDQSCRISHRADGQLLVTFARPQRAVTPGQYACFYDGDICLGGGVIQTTGVTAGTSA